MSRIKFSLRVVFKYDKMLDGPAEVGKMVFQEIIFFLLKLFSHFVVYVIDSPALLYTMYNDLHN